MAVDLVEVLQVAVVDLVVEHLVVVVDQVDQVHLVEAVDLVEEELGLVV